MIMILEAKFSYEVPCVARARTEVPQVGFPDLRRLREAREGGGLPRALFAGDGAAQRYTILV